MTPAERARLRRSLVNAAAEVADLLRAAGLIDHADALDELPAHDTRWWLDALDRVDRHLLAIEAEGPDLLLPRHPLAIAWRALERLRARVAAAVTHARHEVRP